MPHETSVRIRQRYACLRLGGIWALGLIAFYVCGCGRHDISTSAASDGNRTCTFARDVAPIIFSKCACCHHPGEAAPFSLLTYDDVCRRARQIVEVTQSCFMPPWLPKEGHGDFAGSRRLSDQELQTIKNWVDDGAALGDKSELAAPPVFTNGWQAGSPDLVLETPPYQLSSGECDVFRNFVVPIHLDKPRWVQSIELRPDNPRVTHHARLGVDAFNDSFRRDGEDGQPGYPGMAWAQDPDGQLVIWAPGLLANPGKPGIAWRLYPNTYLVLHTHMQPSGKNELVKFHIGIRFTDDAPKQHPLMMRIGTCNIDISPGAAHHVVQDEYTLPVDVDIHSVFPHAHSLCTALRVDAKLPDGSSEPLIAIEHFDENWHDCYRYQKPVRLPKGTRLCSEFSYNNTDENVRNRNHPARRVVYGSNVSDEMADVYLQVTPAQADQRAKLLEHYKQYDMHSQVLGFQKSLEQYPENPWILEGLATYFIGLGEPADAIRILQKRLQTGPPEVYPTASIGMAMLAGGDPVHAEEQERKAIAQDGKYPLAWLGLGKALRMQKKSTEAEDAFRQALQNAPGLSDARLQLADLLLRSGNFEKAAAECSTAIQDSPELPELYLKRAEIRIKQKQYNEGLSDCNLARTLAPYTHPAKVLLAVFCFQNGELEMARSYLLEALAEAPDHPAPPLFLGQLALRDHETSAARKYLSLAETRTLPDNWPDSHKKRFRILLHSTRFQAAQQLQDAELARDSISQWLNAEPENGRLRQLYEELRTGKLGN